MNKRRWLTCGAATVFGLLVLWGAWQMLRLPTDPIQYDNYDKLTVGMTKSEVEVLLGCSAGEYSTGPFDRLGPKFGGMVRYQEHCYWGGDRAEVFVGFDDLGKAQAWSLTERKLLSQWDVARRFLGLEGPSFVTVGGKVNSPAQ